MLAWRIKRKLQTPRAVPRPIVGPTLPPGGHPLLLSRLSYDKPMMLLGPTGSGKSTVLARLSAEASSWSAAEVVGATAVQATGTTMRTGVPVAFLSVRRGNASRDVNTPLTQLQAAAQLDAMAAEIFKEIGFPERRSLLSRFSIALLTLPIPGVLVSVPVTVDQAVSVPRAVQALQLLFSVCVELRDERMDAGLSASDAAPLVLCDEMEDLIKEERLANIGGRIVFVEFARLIVKSVSDKKAVRLLAAGSSGRLATMFDALTIASRNRWEADELLDPSSRDVLRALEALRFTRPEAERVVDACGTRLRLLSPLLKGDVTPAGLDTWLLMAGARARGSCGTPSTPSAPLTLGTLSR